MIKTLNVNKSFGDKQVLFNITTAFEQGKTNLIIGQSGSGKTVLLKSLVGLHDIDSGEIYYRNTKFTKLNFTEKKAWRKDIGMLFQGGALFDSYTVEENVMFPLDLFQDMTFEEKLERVNFCLKRVKLDNVNKLFPSELSGGMQKRVAIARAIVQNPKYLFCDEPNSGLDPRTSIVIDNLISEITHEYNMTTIVNTHDMNSVMEIGENVVYIYQGHNEWEGTKEDIFDSGNEHLDRFIFASNLAKQIKKMKE